MLSQYNMGLIYLSLYKLSLLVGTVIMYGQLSQLMEPGNRSMEQWKVVKFFYGDLWGWQVR